MVNFITEKNSLFIFIGLLVAFGSSESYAQQMCNLIELKVDNVKGRVVTNDQDLYPVSSSQVKLFKINDNDVLIGSTVTDTEGFFDIVDIKPGKYRLVVWATSEKGLTLFTYDVIVKVMKSKNKNKDSHQMIYVKLGGDCFESDAKLVDESLSHSKNSEPDGRRHF